ncbi:MAG: hypothetical protein QM804_05785 [Propionicimonas sp.]
MVDRRFRAGRPVVAGEALGRFEAQEPTASLEQQLVAEWDAISPGLVDRWPYRLV